MTDFTPLAAKRSVSDAVIDGLIAGLVAGFAMGVFLVATGIASGVNPLTTLARFDPNPNSSFFSGALLHLAVSGVYGALFGLLASFQIPKIPRRPFLRLLAIGYSTILLVLASSLIIPRTLSTLAAIPILDLILGHLIYGLVLGFVFTRNR